MLHPLYTCHIFTHHVFPATSSAYQAYNLSLDVFNLGESEIDMDLNSELNANDSDEWPEEDSESEIAAAIDADSDEEAGVDNVASDDEMWEIDKELDNNEHDAELAEEDNEKWDSTDSEDCKDDDAELDEEAEGELDVICNFGYTRF